MKFSFRRVAAVSAAFTLVCLILTVVPAHAQYTFQTISDPNATSVAYPNDGTGTNATGINNAGQVVGFYVDTTGYHGFLDTKGVFTDINVPGAATPNYGTATFAYGINNNGLIVGRYNGPNGPGDEHGFLNSGGSGSVFTTISSPSAQYGTDAFSVNDFGQVAGYYQDGTGIHGYLYSGGTNGTFTPISGPVGAGASYADGVNNAGEVVGAYSDGTGYHGFTFSGGTYTTINAPGAKYGTYLQGVNNDGQVLGYYQDASGDHSFLYNGKTFTSINDINGLGTFATGINDVGQIVGDYRDSTGNHGFVATPAPVPEASSVASFGLMLALGLCMFVVRRVGRISPPSP